MKTEEYFDNPAAIMVTKGTLYLILQQESPGPLLALYLFYLNKYVYDRAKWKRDKAYATAKYTALGLNWSTRKVTRYKQTLLGLDLIRDVKVRDKSGKYIRHYIQVRYVNWTPPGQNPTSGKMSHKELLLRSSKNKKYKETLCESDDSRREFSVFVVNAAKNFIKVLKLWYPRLKNTNNKLWEQQFHLMIKEDKIPKEEIRKVITWLQYHYKDDYVPRVKYFDPKQIRIKWQQFVDRYKSYLKDKGYLNEEDEAYEDAKEIYEESLE